MRVNTAESGLEMCKNALATAKTNNKAKEKEATETCRLAKEETQKTHKELLDTSKAGCQSRKDALETQKEAKNTELNNINAQYAKDLKKQDDLKEQAYHQCQHGPNCPDVSAIYEETVVVKTPEQITKEMAGSPTAETQVSTSMIAGDNYLVYGFLFTNFLTSLVAYREYSLRRKAKEEYQPLTGSIETA